MNARPDPAVEQTTCQFRHIRWCEEEAARVVTKAVAAVFQDGMAITRVSERLTRDFWVQRSERP